MWVVSRMLQNWILNKVDNFITVNVDATDETKIFELFLHDLDEKMTSTGYRTEQLK